MDEDDRVPIFLNDKIYDGPTTSQQTVQQLANEICGSPMDEDAQMIVSILCDGQLIEPNQFDQVLASPIEQFGRLELHAVTIREQVAAALQQAITVLENGHSICENVADALSQGRHDDAMAEMKKLLELFRQAQQTTLLSCQLLGTQPSDLQSGSHNFEELLEKIRQNLTDLKAGMESQDFVLVADLLRYEFAEPLEHWTSFLEQLNQIATTQKVER
ncbi:MAG: hypothetical protein FWC56_01900 [Phycisphaerae bacterium]|nr:hypothetical protein [Phycisphaerae bacterium]